MGKTKRVLALIGVVLLLACYITTFIAAIIDSKATEGLFMASLFCSIGLPVILYGYLLVIKHLKNRSEQNQKEHESYHTDIAKFSNIKTSHKNNETK